MRSLPQRFIELENVLHALLVRHSVTVLRVALGAVFLGFGLLKYFPAVSPAEDLTERTMHLLFLGLVPARAGLIAVATLECFIGVCLLAGKWMRLAIWLLAVEFVGILAPIVLLPGRLFSGPHHAPTLEGQYVLKDPILVAAGMVLAAATFRGGRLVRDEPQLVSVGLAHGEDTSDATGDAIARPTPHEATRGSEARLESGWLRARSVPRAPHVGEPEDRHQQFTG